MVYHLSSFPTEYVCVYVSMHTKVLIQTMDFYSTSHENYSIRFLSVRKFERQNL